MDPASAPPEFQHWLYGYRAVGTRSLENEERAALLARLRRELRRVRIAHGVSGGVTGFAVLGVGSLFASRPDATPALTVVAALGAMLLVAGPIGALLEVAFAPRWWTRLLFAIVLVLAGIGWWHDRAHPGREPGVVAGVGLASSIFVLFVGSALLVSRWRARRTRIQQLQSGIADGQRGMLLLFACPGDEGAKVAPVRRIEVLPESHFLYRMDDRRVDPLSVVPVSRVAVAGPQAEASLTACGHDGHERELSAAECEELRGVRSRARRHATVRVFWALWAAALGFRLIENLLDGALRPRLSGLGWLFVLLAAGLVAFNEIRRDRHLAADLAARKVRRKTIVMDGQYHAIEFLPGTGLVVSFDGAPTRWRRTGAVS